MAPPARARHPGHLVALAHSQAPSLPVHSKQGHRPLRTDRLPGSQPAGTASTGTRLRSPPTTPNGCGSGTFLGGMDACSAPRTLLSRPRVTKPLQGHPSVAPWGPCLALGGLQACTNGGPAGRWEPTSSKAANVLIQEGQTPAGGGTPGLWVGAGAHSRPSRLARASAGVMLRTRRHHQSQGTPIGLGLSPHTPGGRAAGQGSGLHPGRTGPLTPAPRPSAETGP